MGGILKIIQSDKVKKIRDEIEKYCAETLEEYLQECEKECRIGDLSPNNTKNFYDSVWGTIEINEGEIYVLDSPVIQRLRHIKQLGLADLLYSSADHSRFSHTLGVLQTASVMQKRIEKELKKKGQSTDKNVYQLVRLSAIFHDCGHMFCSHASERYFQKRESYSRYRDIDEARKAFDTLEIKPSLSELISVCIVQSPSVKKLLSIIEKGLQDFDISNGKEDEYIEKICCFILGYPYSEKLLPYSQIISGQVDADKLDYLKRDSHSTGVPTAVDMSRVFQKLRVVKTSKEFTMKSTSDEDVDSRYTMAIAPAAINTVDQLIVSRYMMYENVYFHQKTLTAEELLRHALDKLDHATIGLLDDFCCIMKLSDSNIINNNFEIILNKAGENITVKNTAEFGEASEILKNLYTRKLYKRSVAFTTANLVNVGHIGGDFYARILKSVEEQKKFVELVKRKTLDLKETLAHSNFHFNKQTDILLIIAPDVSNVSLNSNLAIAEKNEKYRDMEFEADSWLKSRTTRKPQNYLVTYAEDRYLVYIAAEYILLKYYGMMLSDSVIYDSRETKRIEELREHLTQLGFYKEAYALASDKDIALFNRKLEQLVNEKWKHYELISEYSGTSSSLDMTYITMFLKQFYQFKEEIGGFSTFLKACIKMMERIRIISKGEIFNSLKKNFVEIQERENCSLDRMKVCNIGNVQDGSAQISYQINSINEAFRSKLRVQPLQEALRFSEENQIIVFLEDAFCSGKQIMSIFETYMGIPIEERQTKEEHVVELEAEEKEKLKKSKLYFSFIMESKQNVEMFINRMHEIGLQNVYIVASEEFPSGYFQDEQEKEEKRILKQYFNAAGRCLIHQKAHDESGIRKENWPDKRMQNSMLGYNDAQQLIVFAWNTPTYTLTPLWMQGKREDFLWYPLFPRIDK